MCNFYNSASVFCDTNEFDSLRVTRYMNAPATFRAMDDARKYHRCGYIPYHVFLKIWNKVSRSERVTYDREDHEFVFAEEVERGSRRRRSKEGRLDTISSSDRRRVLKRKRIYTIGVSLSL